MMSAAPDEAGPVDPSEFMALLTDLLQSGHWELPGPPDYWSSRAYVLTGSVRSLPRGLPFIPTREPVPVGCRLASDDDDDDRGCAEYDLTVAASTADSAELTAAARESLQDEADVLVLFHLQDGGYPACAGLFRLAAPIVLPYWNSMDDELNDEECEARWFLMIEGHDARQVMEAVEEICMDHFGVFQNIVESVA